MNMSLKKINIRVPDAHKNQRLDHVLYLLLPEMIQQPVSKGKIRKLIVAGAVYLNRKRVRIASKELRANAQIDVYLDFKKLNSDSVGRDIRFKMTENHILFEDDFIIVVDKPAGLPTQPTLDEARDNLFAAVKKFIQERDSEIQAPPYLGLHHRLDRDTSGVILFTKAPRANPGVSRIFSEHLAQKTYQALVYGSGRKDLPITWSIKNYLGRANGKSQKVAKYGSVKSGGNFAHTDFQLIEALSEGFWVEARPLTGRTHQIRAHLSEFGVPILGDMTYGGINQIGKLSIPRMMLHAVDLTFPHPIHENKMSIRSPLPKDFSQCLKALRKSVPITLKNS